MRRIIGYLALTVAAFGAAQSAQASVFLWAEGANFSYSAAACATPGAAFYAWFLAVGRGATTGAWTACSGPFGASASVAFARAGVGGFGAAFAAGIADPWAGIEVGTTETNFSGSSTFQGDVNNDASEFTSGYTVSPTGITFSPNATDAEMKGLDDLTAYLYTGSESQSTLCAALGGSNCGQSDKTQAGDVTSLNALQSDLSLTKLGNMEVNPSGLGGSTLHFDTTVGNTAEVILVGQGAVATPEPAAFLPLTGLLGALAYGIRRREQRNHAA
jgi:hypothetical protein